MFERLIKIVVDNGSTILRVIGGAAEIATPFLTIKAYEDANQAYVDHIIENPDFDTSDKKEAFKIVWKYYIPPVASTTLTIGCNIAAAEIDNRQITDLACGYYDKYDKTEKLKAATIATFGGAQALEKIENTIMRNTTKPEPNDYLDLFWDDYQKKYFYAEKADVLEAIHSYAKLYNKKGHVSINDFYKILSNPDILPCPSGELEGYNSCAEYCDVNGIDGTDLVSIHKVTKEDTVEHYNLSFLWDPLYNYMDSDCPLGCSETEDDV